MWEGWFDSPCCSFAGSQGVPVPPAAGAGHCQAAAPEPAALAAVGLPQALHRRPLPLAALALHPGGHETLRQLREQGPGAGPEIRALHPGRAAGARGCECCLPPLSHPCHCPAALLASWRGFSFQLWSFWMWLLCLMSCLCLCLHSCLPSTEDMNSSACPSLCGQNLCTCGSRMGKNTELSPQDCTRVQRALGQTLF